MKLAAIQYSPPKGDVERARRELCTLVDAAGSEGAEFIVCPEMATTGYVWTSPEEIGPHSELNRGETFRALAQVARTHRSWVVCGFPERVAQRVRAPEGSIRRVYALHNSAMVITPMGELASTYRKMLLFEADKTWASAGWRRVVFPTDFGRVVPGICMDLNDSGFVDFVHETQPKLVALCTNWVDQGVDVHGYWRNRLSGWSGWMVAANTWGEDSGTCFSGESAILDPSGTVVAKGHKTGNEVLIIET